MKASPPDWVIPEGNIELYFFSFALDTAPGTQWTNYGWGSMSQSNTEDVQHIEYIWHIPRICGVQVVRGGAEGEQEVRVDGQRLY
jgi:hypothetical protein